MKWLLIFVLAFAIGEFASTPTWCSTAGCHSRPNVNSTNSCNEQDKRCNCLAGYGGQHCGEPLCSSCSSKGTRRDPVTNAYKCRCTDNSVSCGSDLLQCSCLMGWSGLNCDKQVGSGSYECSEFMCRSWYEGASVPWVFHNNKYCCQQPNTTVGQNGRKKRAFNKFLEMKGINRRSLGRR